MIYKLLVFCLLWASAATVSAHDTEAIREVIRTFASGVDEHDGDRLRQVLSDNAALFATNPAGDALIVVSPEQFADLHEQKRFGGQPRELSIDDIHVTDNLVANATARAFNAELRYTYYLGLVRLNGEWKIQTLLQRSRAVDSEP